MWGNHLDRRNSHNMFRGEVRDMKEVDFGYTLSSELPQACRARIAGGKVEYRRRRE